MKSSFPSQSRRHHMCPCMLSGAGLLLSENVNPSLCMSDSAYFAAHTSLDLSRPRLSTTAIIILQQDQCPDHGVSFLPLHQVSRARCLNPADVGAVSLLVELLEVSQVPWPRFGQDFRFPCAASIRWPTVPYSALPSPCFLPAPKSKHTTFIWTSSRWPGYGLADAHHVAMGPLFAADRLSDLTALIMHSLISAGRGCNKWVGRPDSP